jgi:trehalose synthase
VLEVSPPSAADPIVAQVSRWDRLKDPIGVMRAFAEHVAPRAECHLVLADPATDAVADDPEGAGVLAAVGDAWHRLDEDARRCVHIASLPMVDVEENAAIVNALQAPRHRGCAEEPG